MAADMRLPPPPPPVVYYDWTGAYIGFNAGSTWSHVDQTFPNPRTSAAGPGSQNNFSTSPSDGIFGFHAGAQWQWGAWVLGAEAALSGCFQECRSTSGVVTTARQHLLRAQDHQPVHGGPATGLRLGPLHDLCDGWLCFGRSQDRGLLVSHRSLRPTPDLTASRATTAGMPAAASTTWSTRARWSTCSSASNINTSTSGSKNAFCFNPGCNPATAWDEDLSAKGDIVRARLTIKTQGLRVLLSVIRFRKPTTQRPRAIARGRFRCGHSRTNRDKPNGPGVCSNVRQA